MTQTHAITLNTGTETGSGGTAIPPATLEATPTDVTARLESLNIPYTLYEHEPVFTVEDGLHLHAIIPGGHCKNLFLKDKKGQRWLISAIETTQIDLKATPKLINSDRLSFGSPERLWESLKVKPGSVTPFALINDTTHHVRVILDKNLFDYDQVNFHPLRNDKSIALSPHDVVRYIESCGHTPQIIDLSGRSY